MNNDTRLSIIRSIVNEYSEKKPIYDKFTDKLHILFEELLTNNDVSHYSIEYRAKEVESLRDKLTKKANVMALDQIADLAGVRIITYYQDDVDRIVNLLKHELKIDEINSEDKRGNLEPNEFGYQSVHIIMELSEARYGLPEWRSYKGYKVEVQVRTVLQHAWASISHALQYKAKHEVPSELQRKLFRLSGIIELADEEFLDIRISHEKLKLSVSKADIIHDDAEINLITLKKYVDESPIVERIFFISLQVGFKDSALFDETPPYEDDEAGEIDSDISALIKFLTYFEISSIKQLDKLLNECLSESDYYLSTLIKTSQTDWWIGKSFSIILLLSFKFKNIINNKLLIEMGWSEEIADRVVREIVANR